MTKTDEMLRRMQDRLPELADELRASCARKTSFFPPGTDSVEQAAMWVAHDFQPREMAAWLEIGCCFKAEAAAHLRSNGFAPIQAQAYSDDLPPENAVQMGGHATVGFRYASGFIRYSKAAEIIGSTAIAKVLERQHSLSGSAGGDVNQWREAALPWLQGGFTAPQVERWLAARCFDPQKARNLRSCELTPEHFSQRTTAGSENYEDTIAFKYVAGVLSLGEAARLIQDPLRERDSAAILEIVENGPAQEYPAVRPLAPQLVKDWLRLGFEAGEVKQWAQVGCWRPQVAARLRQHDVTPQEAALVTTRGYDDGSATIATKVCNSRMGEWEAVEIVNIARAALRYTTAGPGNPYALPEQSEAESETVRISAAL